MRLRILGLRPWRDDSTVLSAPVVLMQNQPRSLEFAAWGLRCPSARGFGGVPRGRALSARLGVTAALGCPDCPCEGCVFGFQSALCSGVSCVRDGVLRVVEILLSRGARRKGSFLQTLTACNTWWDREVSTSQQFLASKSHHPRDKKSYEIVFKD